MQKPENAKNKKNVFFMARKIAFTITNSNHNYVALASSSAQWLLWSTFATSYQLPIRSFHRPTHCYSPVFFAPNSHWFVAHFSPNLSVVCWSCASPYCLPLSFQRETSDANSFGDSSISLNDVWIWLTLLMSSCSL